jgi:hypothetical protein
MDLIGKFPTLVLTADEARDLTLAPFPSDAGTGATGPCGKHEGQLEKPRDSNESPSAEAHRVLYFALATAIEAGLVRTMEDQWERSG